MHLDVLWRDAEVESLSADYDVVILEVQETTGMVVQIHCHGYIGYERIGAWDEIVVESAKLTSNGDFLTRCRDAIEENRAVAPNTGSEDRNRGQWVQLAIRFLDDSHLRIVASRFEVRRYSE